MPVSRDYEQYLKQFGSSKFKELWKAQGHVLARYSAEFTGKRDVAIELPTGGGKTLISLLIGGAWREEGKKVAILSANKTLARQMHAEANALGIPARLMEGRGAEIPAADRRAYQRARCVAIMNYWVYFNQNPVVDPADLLIMDDAHLAEHCLHSLYSLEISKIKNQKLFEDVVRELASRFPEYAVLADALSDAAPPSASAELLSFIDQVEISTRLTEIIDAASADVDFEFRWSRVRQSLREANIYLSRTAIWIRPYVYPLISNQHYEHVQQTLYMSATVGDEGDLSRRLGVRPLDRIPVPPEFAETTSGRRLVVMNRLDDDKDVPQRLQAALLAALRIHPKSLWLCSSEAEAQRALQAVSEWLQGHGLHSQPTWLLKPLGDEIDQFRKAPVGHLFVAGRFDGMDFRGDECRIVVLTTVPRAINLQEEFLTTYLRDSGFMRKRQNQRIVQALGRCTRSSDDYAVYLLADQRFAHYFGRDSNREGITQNIMAEIDMAQDLAEHDDAKLVAYVERFLRGDFTQYDVDAARYHAEAPSPKPKVDKLDTSGDEVVGWAALYGSQNYPTAATRFEACWDAAKNANVVEIGALHGWHWAKALFLQSLLDDASARHKALSVLEAAIARGGQSSWFNRMRASLGRARADLSTASAASRDDFAEAVLRTFDDKLERLGTTGDRFQRWCDNTFADLSSTKHPQFQAGLESLGTILGYTATRPKYGAATDCRWRGVFGNLREVVTFEAKVEHTPSNKVTATDLGQGHNQLARANAEYGATGYTVRGTLVTHLLDLHGDAVSSLGSLKVIRKDATLALWQRVQTLLSRYRSAWSLDDVKARAAAAQAIRPLLPPSGWLTRALDGATLFVDEKALLREWRLPSP